MDPNETSSRLIAFYELKLLTLPGTVLCTQSALDFQSRPVTLLAGQVAPVLAAPDVACFPAPAGSIRAEV